jgi:phospholipid-binding lipoprotein MlaA
MSPALRGCAAFLAAVLLAVAPAGSAGAGDAVAPDGPDAGSDPPAHDPWEPVNRPIFAFNDFLSRHVLEPVGRGWKFVVPQFVRDSVSRLYVNVRTPAVMVNDLLQGKPLAAGVDLARFVLNSSVGLAGLMDPAAAIGLEPNDEDFGQTFGVWGVPAGPYLVLPLLGPSSPRDAVGRAADGAAAGWGWFVPFWASASIASVDTVNSVSFFADDIARERKEAFDWYAAVRNAHVSHRENQVRDRAESPEEEEDDLYRLEEEMEE